MDKFFLKGSGGYEALGIYGLLWRFGGIYQMVTIAMIDAWVVVAFNAHKQQMAIIISTMMMYYAILIDIGALWSVMGAAVQYNGFSQKNIYF